ncbi:MurR/RpiR family transcriptional regulator [Deinococcus maricopensis]|uniref:Transcriptional regulator, RpiR family n=1 Tax=Deinococcus maricopensis (strain DSM 21211 / LMG 22137 / NRRL B-23946 / LB-34) TaxID=709986 RepID=E8U636_DEIML|nr:MurR/RpiR family transcriptional regulator [Deinococcus maricopensis]ADV66525.1 transcriptional regulator, RpiR family [Deinococcus maricopensis DSM 21211]
MTTLPHARHAPQAGAIGRIKLQAHALTPSLHRVATHILERPHTVVHQTITELAQDARVGESSITRLCRKLGYPGFHAFKLALTADVVTSTPTPTPHGTTPSERASWLVRQTTLTLEETTHLLNAATLERAAYAIAHAPRVDVTGQGNSGFMAQYFAHRLMRVGISATAHTDPHLAAVGAATLPEQGVMIGITASGSTIDTVHHLRLARERGRFTLAITQRASSPVTRHADAVLYAAGQEAPLNDDTLTSFTSQALLLDVLYTTITPHLPNAPDTLRRTAESVVEKKY